MCLQGEVLLGTILCKGSGRTDLVSQVCRGGGRCQHEVALQKICVGESSTKVEVPYLSNSVAVKVGEELSIVLEEAKKESNKRVCPIFSAEGRATKARSSNEG